jgi:hypothetical protein
MGKIKLILFLLIINLGTTAQVIATFTIETGKTETVVPVNINLDEYTFLSADSLILTEKAGNTITILPFQVVIKDTRMLTWIIHPQKGLSKRVFQLTKYSGARSAAHDEFRAINKNGAISFMDAGQPLLNYQFQTVYPPAGIDTNYKRSGFIHPLLTPHGQVLTAIQPKDHYHHYGIWNPWTHTVFEKDTVDFWNIKGRQGTVRFAKFISQTNGRVFSEVELLHEHVRFQKDGTEKVALNELQTIRVYNPQGEKDYYIVDFISQLSCATESPLLIVAYRYGGLGWRATEEWTKENCEVITSEGKNRKNTDGTKARWIATQGTLGNDYGGLLMMSYPTNYNYPEPLRIWDENSNGGRGDIFVNFAPTKDKDWLLEPGKTYTLKYRFLVYNGKMTAEKAEAAWKSYVKPVALSK